ncbi:MAG: tyrosine-protein phosphatase [Erysipelotrichaceae bacterium]|nr:tyrosine-protein phosphatase [Erysipelotrichaceae bacterium]
MKRNTKKILAIAVIILIIIGMVGSLLQAARPAQESSGLPVPAETQIPEQETVPSIEATVSSISKYGNVVLSVSPETMISLGFEPGDLVEVTANETSMIMPVGTAYSDVESGDAILTYKAGDENNDAKVIIAINMGNFASAMKIAEKKDIEESPGYEWEYIDGFDEYSPILIRMHEKQGYADEYALHQVIASRTNERSDYSKLSDEEYANFREIRMGSIGTGTLYRSSSPIDPSLNRNQEADEALLKAQIKTVMNMADHEDDMKAFEGYSKTYYSDCRIIALNMGMDFSESSFTDKLAEGFRFLSENKGPYLIHCKEGKDRTGFACAILEALMGASADEIAEDYMLTYCNFYGVEKNSETYRMIAEKNIVPSLEKAFGIDDLYEVNDQLDELAEAYLLKIGMSNKEITDLKNNLSAEYGGMDLK